MAGSRPFTTEEISLVLNNLKTPRNRCLFIFGLYTGFRISEILSITVQDLVQYNKIKESVTIHRKNMKGKISSRTVMLHSKIKLTLEELGILKMDFHLKVFPITRVQAHRILKEAISKAKIEGRVTTHSMRKTYAQKMYEKLGKDLRKTQIATGHKNLNSLAYYLQYDQNEINKAILEN